MISQTVIDNAVTILNLAYTAASSTCVVVGVWPEPWNDPLHPVLILHEGNEVDALIGGAPSQQRGTPGPPAYAYEPDLLYATYRQPGIDRQSSVTMAQAQAAMRADKAVLLNVFKKPADAPYSGHVPLTLDGACMEAGKVIKVTHPLTGPYEQGDTQGAVRFWWRASITIRANMH